MTWLYDVVGLAGSLVTETSDVGQSDQGLCNYSERIIKINSQCLEMSAGSNIVFSDFKSQSEVYQSEMMKQIISKEMKYQDLPTFRPTRSHLSSTGSPQLAEISVLEMLIS